MQGAQPFISTAPMPVALNALNIEHEASFTRAAINVERYRVPNCDAHQTVYFPDPAFRLYRASITGNILIIESVRNDDHTRPIDQIIFSAFGIKLIDCDPLGKVSQEYGKIINLPDATRRALMYKLTSEHGIYSLGRFAQWRNILLDDVVEDIHVIRKLLATDGYGLRKAAS